MQSLSSDKQLYQAHYIPECWSVAPFKMLFTLGRGLNITKADLVLDGVRCLSYGNVHSSCNGFVDKQINSLPYVSHKHLDYDMKCLVTDGDFVFADTSEDIDGSGNFSCISSGETLFAGYHTIICRLKSKSTFNYRFIAYVLSSEAFKDQIRCQVKGIKVYSITQQILKSAKVWFPKLNAQKAIANFLDGKCAEIDALSADIEKQIETLQEYKKSVITEAVTKGLDPNVEMRDSGIDVIGDIPKDWTLIPLKLLFSFGRGLNITKADLVSEGIRCLSYGHVHSSCNGFVDNQIATLPYVSDKFIDLNKKCLVSEGDFIFADTSEDIEGSGNFSCISCKATIFAGYHTIVCRLNKKQEVDYRYICYVLSSQAFKHQIRRQVKGIKVFSITQQILKSASIWLPDRALQKTIVKFLDKQCIEIDSVIESKRKQLEVLPKHKQSLIYEYVTGKKSVPNV